LNLLNDLAFLIDFKIDLSIPKERSPAAREKAVKGDRLLQDAKKSDRINPRKS
jgi:hypothetical protein